MESEVKPSWQSLLKREILALGEKKWELGNDGGKKEMDL
jgi:hypothetical protein